MRDIAKEAYENTAVGSVGFMRPDLSKGETIQGFQNVESAADAMQSNGLIRVLDKHRESQSGRRLIEFIQFRRVG